MAYYNPYYSYVQNNTVNTAPLYNGVSNVRTPDFLTGQNQSSTQQPAGTQALGGDNQGAQKPGTNWGGVAGAAAAGLSQLDTTSQANPQAPDAFEIDQWAGYKASGQGFATAGPFGAIIGGAVAQLNTFNNVHKNLDALDRSVGGVNGYDAYGRPIYNSGAIANKFDTLKALKRGAYRTTHTLDPGQPTIALIRGTRRKLRKAAADVTKNIQFAQQDFTNKANQYNAQELAMAQYNQSLNNRNRINTLYNIGQQLY